MTSKLDTWQFFSITYYPQLCNHWCIFFINIIKRIIRRRIFVVTTSQVNIWIIYQLNLSLCDIDGSSESEQILTTMKYGTVYSVCFLFNKACWAPHCSGHHYWYSKHDDVIRSKIPRVFGPLCGNSPVTSEFPAKASDAELWCFLWSGS